MGYTVINAQVTDQALLLTNSPKLASGGVNEIQVVFAFCSLWGGAASKTAIFYRDKAAVYHKELADDACLAPWEPFATEGTVYMGVFAEYSDGTTRTSEVVALTIDQGAITTGSAPANAPDIYAALAGRVEDLEKEVANMDTGSGGTASTLTSISVTEAADGTVTMVNKLESGSETIVISPDEGGNPASVTVNGTAIPVEWTVETTEENTAVEGETA